MTSTRFMIASSAVLLVFNSAVEAQPAPERFAKDQAPPATCAMPGMAQADTQPISTTKGDPYTLNVCPVSGKKLGTMGDPIVKVYDGREVRFCCGQCPATFEADRAGYFHTIDAMIVKDQLAAYPLDTCVISGESLTENGEDIAINMVYQNRLVRLCCKKCMTEFKTDPAANMAKLDAAVIAVQSETYPLETCVVSGEALGGEMSDVITMVVANRMVRLCCKMCKKDLLADPASYLQTVDAAWASMPSGMPGLSIDKPTDSDTAEAPGQNDTDTHDDHNGQR